MATSENSQGVALIGPANPDETDGPKKLVLQMPLNEDAEPDVLFLEFWETEEPFLSQGFVPLTQTLNGNQADLITCGVCSFIAANFVDASNIDLMRPTQETSSSRRLMSLQIPVRLRAHSQASSSAQSRLTGLDRKRLRMAVALNLRRFASTSPSPQSPVEPPV